jgi:hypothetical protein
MFHASESFNPFIFERYTPKYTMSKKLIVSWVMAMCKSDRMGSEEDRITFGVSVTLAMNIAKPTQSTIYDCMSVCMIVCVFSKTK